MRPNLFELALSVFRKVNYNLDFLVKIMKMHSLQAYAFGFYLLPKAIKKSLMSPSNLLQKHHIIHSNSMRREIYMEMIAM